MKVELTSPVKGKSPGETVDVPDGEARWLIANGYARVDNDASHLLDTSVEASADPTLAANREAPGEPVGSIANDEDSPSHSAQVVERAEYKGKSARGKGKIVPGDPATNVAAASAELEDEQPPASQPEQSKDVLAGKGVAATEKVAKQK